MTPLLSHPSPDNTYLRSLDKASYFHGIRDVIYEHIYENYFNLSTKYDNSKNYIIISIFITTTIALGIFQNLAFPNLSFIETIKNPKNFLPLSFFLLSAGIMIKKWTIYASEHVFIFMIKNWNAPELTKNPEEINAFIEKSSGKIIEYSQGRKKKALIIESSIDRMVEDLTPIQKIYIRSGIIVNSRHRIISLKQLGYAVERVTVDSKKEVTTLLDPIQDGSLDLIFFDAHGDPGGIHFNNQFYFDGLSQPSLSLIQQLGKKLRHIRSSFILDSCSTARGKKNFAQKLSLAFPNATVHAPVNEIDLFGGCALTKSRRKKSTVFPLFTLGSKTIAHKIYRNGCQV